MFAVTRSIFALPRLIRLVDFKMRCLDSVSLRSARKRNGCICSYFFPKQNGCAEISGV